MPERGPMVLVQAQGLFEGIAGVRQRMAAPGIVVKQGFPQLEPGFSIVTIRCEDGEIIRERVVELAATPGLKPTEEQLLVLRQPVGMPNRAPTSVDRGQGIVLGPERRDAQPVLCQGKAAVLGGLFVSEGCRSKLACTEGGLALQIRFERAERTRGECCVSVERSAG